MKVAVVTAIYGGYDTPKPIGWTDSDVQGYLWTDSDDIAREAADLGWNSVLDEYPDGRDCNTPMLHAKFVKTHTWLGARYDADVLIWLDGSMIAIVPDLPARCVEALGDDDASFTPHPLRTCIRTEALVTAALARYSDCDPIKQVNYYDSIGHPRDWGLFASGAFTLRNNDLTIEFGDHWWYENVHRTYQDQLSLPVIVRLMERKGMKWNNRMPWAQWWGIANHLR